MALMLALSAPVGAAGADTAPCGGDFAAWMAQLQADAVAAGHAPDLVARVLGPARPDPAVLKADRGQQVFQRPFLDFSARLASRTRLDKARQLAGTHQALFARAAQATGVPAGILLAFWAFETDFGQVQGDFNTRDALVTLAHDCRRPDLFRPQIMALLTLAGRGDLDPATTTGAWAGEIGQVQMLPRDILVRGVDGDGDGRVDLKRSIPDAIMSGAGMLRDLGWRADEPWLQEIIVPDDLDWGLTGLDRARPMAEWQAMGVRARARSLPPGEGAILLPQGRKGPAFMTWPNFQVLFEWNRSLVYVTTAAWFAARIEGAGPLAAGQPEPGLDGEGMRRLQGLLAARGHDVGAIDGILGAMTRRAVQAEQLRLGLPADAWPTPALLRELDRG